MTETDALAVFAALSHPTRLRILRALVAAAPTGLTAGALAERVVASPSRASFHLASMSEAGLVGSTRAARNVTYHVRFEALGRLAQFVLDDCCKGHPDARACLAGACGECMS